MEDYIKCELIGGGSPRHLNTFLTCMLLLYTTHVTVGQEGELPKPNS